MAVAAQSSHTRTHGVHKPGIQPSFEIIKPVCTCGAEHSRFFYELTAEKSFRDFALEFNVPQVLVNSMTFKTRPADRPRDLREFNLKSCCLRTLRTGSVLSITTPIFQGVGTIGKG